MVLETRKRKTWIKKNLDEVREHDDHDQARPKDAFWDYIITLDQRTGTSFNVSTSKLLSLTGCSTLSPVMQTPQGPGPQKNYSRTHPRWKPRNLMAFEATTMMMIELYQTWRARSFRQVVAIHLAGRDSGLDLCWPNLFHPRPRRYQGDNHPALKAELGGACKMRKGYSPFIPPRWVEVFYEVKRWYWNPCRALLVP